MSVPSDQRHTQARPCGVCGGYEGAERGGGKRCHGFRSSDGTYEHCSRDDHAGGLPIEASTSTYAHRMGGPCKCGATHREAARVARDELGPVVATYRYHDEAGAFVYEVRRHVPKTFRPWLPGARFPGLGKDTRRVLYRLPELLAADPSTIVFVTEGEKDADNLAALGLVVTTNDGGTGKGWPAEQSRHLAGRRVVILPHNDAAGREHGNKVEATLRPHAAALAQIKLRGLPDKGDVSDWLAAGGTSLDLLTMAEAILSGERQPGEDDEAPAEEDTPDPGDTFSGLWEPLPISYLIEAPPARKWLLRRPTADDKPCPPSQGDGMLPLGKVGLFVADGGVGKTMALVALAVSVVTGRPWFGCYHVPYEAQDGRVLLALGEEDAEEVHRRLYAVSTAYQLTDNERAKVAAQLLVLPLAGRAVALVDDTGATTPVLHDLRARLKAQNGAGWSLVAIDPFSRFAATQSEVDNAIATRTIQACESMVAAPGTPTVLIAHHAPSEAIKTGAIRARGVTGIRDAVRWEATLRADGPDVWFRQSKSNYSRPMTEEIRLIRGPEGVMRVANEDEQAEYDAADAAAHGQRDAAKDARREARIADIQDRLLAKLAICANPPTSQAALTALVDGSQAERVQAVARLLASGKLVRPAAKGEPYTIAGMA